MKRGFLIAATGVLIAAMLTLRGLAAAIDVTTIAGTGNAGFTGDGGPALLADLYNPVDVAVAPDGTIYFSDPGNYRIRRITPDGTIATIAGTGEYGYAGDGGPALSASFANVTALALDAPRNALYLADTDNRRVRRVDLVSGQIDAIADLEHPQGIAVTSAGTLYVAETLMCRIVRIDPSVGGVITYAGLPGTCTSTGDGGPAASATFYLPTRVAVDAADNLFVVDTFSGEFSSVPSYRIRRIESGTTTVTTVAGGGATEPGTGPAIGLDLGLVTAIAPDLTSGGAGQLLIAQEFEIFAVDLATGQLTPFAGSGVGDFLDGPAGQAMFGVVAGLAYSPSGDVIVADLMNNRIRRITQDGGTGSDDISFIGTTHATIGCPPGVIAVQGNVTITGNIAATSINCGSLASVGGDLDIRENAGATVVDLSSLESVGGNFWIESTGTGTFDATACAGGSTHIDATGYATVLATTALSGSTEVTSTNGNSISLALPPGAFNSCVTFALTRVAVAPEAGTDANGHPVIADAIDAYHIEFDVPTLGQPATLTFDIVLATLTPARQIELLEALNTGLVTLVTRSDVPGAAFQAFPICAAGQQPSVDGCVGIETLDATGNPTSGSPTLVRFTGVVGHFSTWAVAILRPPVYFNGLLQPYPALPHATTPTFTRGSVVPLKFNWVNAAGAVIESASANPGIAIRGGTCSDEPSTAALPAEDAGSSQGWRYDAASRTWIFGWSTRPLAAGCYWIEITSGTSALPSAPNRFPVALRER